MFARTRRLTLRPGWPEDAAQVTRAIAHESVVSRLSRLPWPYREEDAATWLALPRTTTNFTCLIFAHERPTPHLIGAIGVHPAADLRGHELGYWLTPTAWGHGYATEAGQAVLGMARHALGLTHLAARHHTDNPASGAVLRKLGFHVVGQGTLFSRAHGVELPTVLLSADLAGPAARLAA